MGLDYSKKNKNYFRFIFDLCENFIRNVFRLDDSKIFYKKIPYYNMDK